MAKQIRWDGFGVRHIHGYVFRPGQVIEVESDEIALDILTQPGEPFTEIDPESAGETTPPKRRK